MDVTAALSHIVMTVNNRLDLSAAYSTAHPRFRLLSQLAISDTELVSDFFNTGPSVWCVRVEEIAQWKYWAIWQWV
jgi:hypothetical protein